MGTGSNSEAPMERETIDRDVYDLALRLFASRVPVAVMDKGRTALPPSITDAFASALTDAADVLGRVLEIEERLAAR
jgi:hypothetical protein